MKLTPLQFAIKSFCAFTSANATGEDMEAFEERIVRIMEEEALVGVQRYAKQEIDKRDAEIARLTTERDEALMLAEHPDIGTLKDLAREVVYRGQQMLTLLADIRAWVEAQDKRHESDEAWVAWVNAAGRLRSHVAREGE